MVVLKITFGEEVRRFSNVRPNCLNFYQFCLDLQKIFPALGPTFQIKYVDDENEEVHIGNDVELQDAIILAEHDKRLCLRLTVERGGAGPRHDFGNPSFLSADVLPPLNFNIPGVGALQYNSSSGGDGMPSRSGSFADNWDPLVSAFDDDDEDGGDDNFSGFPGPFGGFGPGIPNVAALAPVGGDGSGDVSPVPNIAAAKSKAPVAAPDAGAPAAKQARRSTGGARASSAPSPAPTKATSGRAKKGSKKASAASSGNDGASASTSGADSGGDTAAGVPKLLRRRARNRVSARKSRMRKKLYHDSLQVANDVLTEENKTLKKRVTELEAKLAAATGAPPADANATTPTAGGVTSVVATDNKLAGSSVTSKNLVSGDLQLLSQVDFLNKSFCICDPNQVDNPIIYCSDSFVKLTGYPRQEILGRNCRFLQGPKTDASAVQAIRDAIEKGCDAEVKILNYRKDGSVFWNNFFIAALRDETGHIVHFVGVQQEIKFPANMPQPKQTAKSVYPSDYKPLKGEQKQKLQRPTTSPKPEPSSSSDTAGTAGTGAADDDSSAKSTNTPSASSAS